MAVYQALLLNTVVPQIQAAQAGDSYVMVVNATTPALRITQTGTGDSILVEDAANPDSSPFVVTAAGDVGIGTSSPGQKLTVNGVVASIGPATALTASSAFFDYNTTSNLGRFAAVGNTTGTAAPIYFSQYSSNASVGRDAMIIDASGNLGLGVTPSASTIAQFEGGSNLLMVGRGNAYLSNNATFNSSFKYINTAAAGQYNISGAVHSWYTAPSGTAGDPITFTQVLTLDGIDGSGYGKNLKLGGTADRATTKGTHHFDIFDGTAPVGTLANGISLYSSSGEAYVMDAAGNATLFSPHDSETNEWIFKSKHTPSGKVLKIDVEKMLRFINDHFGLDAIHEFTEE